MSKNPTFAGYRLIQELSKTHKISHLQNYVNALPSIINTSPSIDVQTVSIFDIILFNRLYDRALTDYIKESKLKELKRYDLNILVTLVMLSDSKLLKVDNLVSSPTNEPRKNVLQRDLYNLMPYVNQMTLNVIIASLTLNEYITINKTGKYSTTNQFNPTKKGFQTAISFIDFYYKTILKTQK